VEQKELAKNAFALRFGENLAVQCSTQGEKKSNGNEVRNEVVLRKNSKITEMRRSIERPS
jgi:hypothetical protein